MICEKRLFHFGREKLNEKTCPTHDVMRSVSPELMGNIESTKRFKSSVRMNTNFFPKPWIFFSLTPHNPNEPNSQGSTSCSCALNWGCFASANSFCHKFERRTGLLLPSFR